MSRVSVDIRAAERDAATRFTDHYMRMAITFQTGAPRYGWLNRHLFIAEGVCSTQLRLSMRCAPSCE